MASVNGDDVTKARLRERKFHRVVMALPPRCMETERAVLAHMLVGPAEAGECRDKLQRMDFYSGTHASLFDLLATDGHGSDAIASAAATANVKPVKHPEVQKAMSLLRRLRVKRGVLLAADKLFMESERDDWLDLAEKYVANLRTVEKL